MVTTFFIWQYEACLQERNTIRIPAEFLEVIRRTGSGKDAGILGYYPLFLIPVTEGVEAVPYNRVSKDMERLPGWEKKSSLAIATDKSLDERVHLPTAMVKHLKMSPGDPVYFLGVGNSMLLMDDDHYHLIMFGRPRYRIEEYAIRGEVPGLAGMLLHPS